MNKNNRMAMKSLLTAVFLLTCAVVNAQALRDINYNYLYNPETRFHFQLKPVRMADGWKILYSLELKDTTNNLDEYSIAWELRNALSDKQGTTITSSSAEETKRSSALFTGTLSLPSQTEGILVANVTSNVSKSSFLFYTYLETNFPVNNYLLENQQPVVNPFVVINQNVSIPAGQPLIVSRYKDTFPPAALVFAEKQARVSKAIATDSIFTVSPENSFTLSKKGLYLFQADTLSTQGFALRAEEDYPRYRKLQNLAGPLIYICTKEEYDRIELAQGDKKAFDRVILGITNDTERARTLIRNYFRRAELANVYFTSYKEGWKTDRGMIYIIFGLPDQVFRFADREVWKYSNEFFKASFDFVKTPSIFDPNNYVLVREKKYEKTWYEVVDLWRNARL
jgi:GWxTD domain-containing protein